MMAMDRIERERRRRKRVACAVCGRRGTTGIKVVDGRPICRKRAGCVDRVCRKVFLEQPKMRARLWDGDMVYLGELKKDVKFYGVVSGPDTPGMMQATLQLADLQGAQHITFDAIDVNSGLMRKIFGVSDAQP